MPRRKKPLTVVEDEQTYEVTVWNDVTGDIVKKLWDANANEVEDVREQFEDEPFHSVQVEDH